MPAFVLPLTIAAADGRTELLVDLAGRWRLGDVQSDLTAHAGLPADTRLYLGAGPVDPNWVLGRTPLLAGAVLSTTPDADIPAQAAVAISCVAGPDAGGWHPLTESTVTIGRAAGTDLSVGDPALSRRHAEFGRRGHRLTVTDLRSANGLRVNGRAIPRAGASIGSGQILRMGASLFRVGLTAEPALILDPDARGGLRAARPARILAPFRHPVPPEPGPLPEAARRPLPLLAALLGAVAGVGIALVTGMWMFLLLAALGPVMMIGTAVGDRLTGRRSHRQQLAAHAAAVAADEQALAHAAEADRLDAWDRYPDPASLLRRARSPAARLWERRPADPDFLRLVIGVGSRPMRVDRAAPPAVDEVPVTIGLSQIGVLGLTGRCRPLLRSMLASAICLHAPSDLRVLVLSDGPDLQVLEQVEHASVPGKPGEVVGDPERAGRLLRELLDDAAGPAVMLVLDGARRWRRLALVRRLLELAAVDADPDAGMSEPTAPHTPPHGPRPASRLAVICLDATAQALPVECRAVATVTGHEVTVTTGTSTVLAEPVGVSAAHLSAVCRALAPLRDPDRAGGALATTVGLRDLRRGRPTEPDWSQPRLAAPLGLSADGILDCDLERDGPHLLIAGTTGSGKSELLLTLVTGLALAAPPEHTAFLLVDYKGGAAFGELTSLPHTTGMLTDLDQDLAARALTSLRAEVRRRERLLQEAGAGDLRALRARGPAPFGSLVIVVDEFATLAAELPDFLTGLLDVAQRGRSLGLHLVLATQRPAGVLSPAIKANIALRICLRVADPADSLDVVDTPDAARIPRSVPGRAILRGEGSAVLFQAARVTTGPPPPWRVRLRHGPFRPGTDAGPTDLERVVRRCRELADDRRAGVRPPRPAWLAPLPAVITAVDLPDLLPGIEPESVLVVVDRPATASRGAVAATDGSVLIAGAPGSGRTAALRRVAACAARAGSELVVLDPAGVLADLGGWHCCGTLLDGRDPHLVQRTVELLHDELTRRAGRPGPPIQVLIDDWEAVTGPLDLATFGAGPAQLAELAGRGPAAGIRVAASGDQRLRHHRCAASFGTVLVLGPDPDRTATAGAAALPPGRGRCADEQVQVVLADPDPPPDAVRPRFIVRELPGTVNGADLPAPCPEAVPIGRGGDAAGPVTMNLIATGGGFLVAGPRRSGVSSTLQVLAQGAAAAGVRTLRVVVRPQPELSGVMDVDVSAGAGELFRALDNHDGPLVLVADDLTDEHPAADVLKAYLAATGTGHHLLAGCRLDLAARSYRGLIAEVAAFRSGVLLQADAPDGAVLDAVLPRRRGPTRAGRGHLVTLGEVMPLQVSAPA